MSRPSWLVLATSLVILGCSSASTTSTPTPTVTVASIALSTSAATLFATTTLQLTATPRDASGNALSGQTITWTSSAPTVATVSTTGLVTTVGGGTATITAAIGTVNATAAITSEAITLVLDSGQQLMHAGQLDAHGMTGVPDMHTAFLQRADGSYRVWFTQNFMNDSILGATGMMTTTDFLTYTPMGGARQTQPVLIPSCRFPFALSCANNIDEYYAGADWVYPASNGTDLLMLYHAGSHYYSGTDAPTGAGPNWSVVGLARSSDSGATWTGRTAVLSSADTKPTTPPTGAIFGLVEPGIIAANGYIYAFYANFPLVGSSTIQMARAPLSGDAAPGTWIKYNNGWGSQPGLGGTGSPVIATTGVCTRPAQPWPVYSSYINGYLLIFICTEGWFVSESTDLVNWSKPVQILNEPTGEFNTATEENVTLVTRGNAPQVIGQTGYALYAYTPNWTGNVGHYLWMRPFTIRKTP